MLKPGLFACALEASLTPSWLPNPLNARDWTGTNSGIIGQHEKVAPCADAESLRRYACALVRAVGMEQGMIDVGSGSGPLWFRCAFSQCFVFFFYQENVESELWRTAVEKE
ncbi:hypothetical protein C8R45DRAFT_920086 [Mycena sanguinolenta]|nr:hypothetical protein C8R45DRAFT_920086 [Mycena sanguinolenta]